MSAVIEEEPRLIDLAEATDAPPRVRRPRSKGMSGSPVSKPVAAKPELPRTRDGAIAKGMTRLYAMVGAGVGFMDMETGAAIMESAEGIGKAWENYAKQNPKMKKALLSMLEGSAVMELVAAHIPVGFAIGMKYAPDSVKEKFAGKMMAAMMANVSTTEDD